MQSVRRSRADTSTTTNIFRSFCFFGIVPIAYFQSLLIFSVTLPPIPMANTMGDSRIVLHAECIQQFDPRLLAARSRHMPFFERSAQAMSVSLLRAQSVQHIDSNASQLVIYTETLLFVCCKISQVEPDLAPDDTIVVCEPSIDPHVSSELRSVTTPQSSTSKYWGILNWKLDFAMCFDRVNGTFTEALPDFRQVIVVQQAMSSAGLSLPMHGCAAVSVGPPDRQYCDWMFLEGLILTQPWVRAMLTVTLQRYHSTSPHTCSPVGILCLDRPYAIPSDLSLAQARWLATKSTAVQSSVTQCFAAAVEHGVVHVAANHPSSVAVDCHGKAYLINWTSAMQRVRLRGVTAIAYLLTIPERVVETALRQRLRVQ